MRLTAQSGLLQYPFSRSKEELFGMRMSWKKTESSPSPKTRNTTRPMSLLWLSFRKTRFASSIGNVRNFGGLTCQVNKWKLSKSNDASLPNNESRAKSCANRFLIYILFMPRPTSNNIIQCSNDTSSLVHLFASLLDCCIQHIQCVSISPTQIMKSLSILLWEILHRVPIRGRIR